MTLQILQSSAILLLIALGGLISERSGILNIGLEGMITVGAFAAVLAATFGAPWPIAVAGGILAASLLAAVFAQFALRWRANPFIVGLAINLLAAGIIPLLSEIIFDTRGSIRLVTAALPTWPVLTIAAAATGLVHVFFYHTASGIRLRVAGEQPDWLRAQGVGVKRYQLMALVGSGVLAGAAGALLALRIGVYLPGISAGRGWIALVIVFLGYRYPFGLAAAALLFGAIDAAAVRAQAVTAIPPTVLLSTPYLFTVIAFVSYAAIMRRRPGGHAAES